MENLFGNSAYSTQITRTISVGTSSLLGSDKYLNYDRTNGDIILELPKLSSFLESNSKSGNTLSLYYILSDLTSGVSQNSITLICDSSDNINGNSSFVTDENSIYILQATPAGWLLVNQVSTESKGIFNTSGLTNIDLSNQNLAQYYAVSVNGTSNTTGVNYSVSYSSVLEYFSISNNTDMLNFTFSNNIVAKTLTFSNPDPLSTVVIGNNPLLTKIAFSYIGLTNGTVTNFTIKNSPLLNDVNIQNNQLSVSSVDSILAYLDSTGVTGGTLYIDGGLNAIPTGGAGNPNVLSLIGKGWTVSHN